MNENFQGLTLWATLQKRTFDLFLAFLGTILFWWLILLAALLAWIDTGENGFFTQKRVGQYGNIFKVIKIRTMRSVDDIDTTVTTSNDLRITSLGHFFRRTKIDELPQLINVFLGDMSFVGPRPDVPGFADKLKGDDRVVLSIKPGITGPATLQFRNEEMLLAEVENPEEYNNEVIYPEKVRLNKEYITNYSIVKDIRYIFLTLMGK
ncbi:MAG: sugar transferase [Candidatus Electrothrix sp. AW1]|nr:sugar transferase [Candidatus Electrothrix sp. AX1]MCI5182594.1 sugar transferase [Candidatus Electrothrix gigas]